MKNYRELAVLLPCHSLEDFPLYHTGEDADSLLACWTALWHPRLVATTAAGPKWHRVDLPPEDLQNSLLLVPTVSFSQLPTGFAQRAKDAGAVLITRERDRQSILDRALQPLDDIGEQIDADLTADFLALGYAYLQVQILTRQMRYSSNLDETHFFNQFVAAATAAQSSQVEEARSKLTSCFDLLASERDHFYSVDAYVLDLTLVAESTVGATLRDELARGTPLNLLLSGEVLELMAEREPESLKAVLLALQEQRAAIVGGEYSERQIPLLSCEGILAELRRGQSVYERYLQRRVEVYGRRRFGLTPVLPGILEKLKFIGAWHATLDDGLFPAAAQTKTRWQGVDASAIDAIAKPPLDASRPETFLSLAQKLGESMDSDHVATLCMAHLPRVVSPWYDDLRRCARYTASLGKFTTVDHFFSDTYRPGSLDRFEANQYKSPYLKQAVIRRHVNPITSVVSYWKRRVSADAAEALAVMSRAIAPQLVPSDLQLSDLAEQTQEAVLVELDQKLDAVLDDLSKTFAGALPKKQGPSQSGFLVTNPFGFTRRVGIEVTELAALPAVEQPVVAAGMSDNRKFVVVDVPSMGYAWLQAGSTEPPRRKGDPPLAEDDRDRNGVLFLRNEFFELSIDPVTGMLKALSDYQSRRNRWSQQLALRIPGGRGQPGDVWRDPDETAQYSVMAADEARIVMSNTAVGEVLTRGRLLDQEGGVLANYLQTYRVWRGSRVIGITIELEPKADLSSDAWNSYFACRFAWPDETASLFASVNQTRQPVKKQKVEAPLYVDVDNEAWRTTILTGGLPFHRRVGSRMLDSLLIVRGERGRQFRLGIGIDLPQSLPEALSWIAPTDRLGRPTPAPAPEHSWLFHIDSRSVTPTYWTLIQEQGRVCGIRVRLLEGAGKSGRIKLSAFRSFTTARQINLAGETLNECPIVEGRIAVDVSAHEWIEVEGRWN